MLEGAKLLVEALDAGAPIESVYVAHRHAGIAAGLLERAAGEGARVYELDEGVLERVADTATPQPLLAITNTADVALDELTGARLVVVFVDVRDPGNAGTAVRSAEAAGADGVIFCRGSVDVYNPKTVRASAGSLFHVKVVAGGAPLDVLDDIGGWGAQRLAAVARGGRPYTDADLTGPTALVFGNEANGLPPDVAARCDLEVSIPMRGRAESLNVGVATAVLAFEAARQRDAAHAPEVAGRG